MRLVNIEPEKTTRAAQLMDPCPVCRHDLTAWRFTCDILWQNIYQFQPCGCWSKDTDARMKDWTVIRFPDKQQYNEEVISGAIRKSLAGG